ncbi:MAG TPA: ABC transporter transmembrane domain-containing protein, partial [Flavisolibacter sp.]|nr:ABC transporter transmembrane domain-containing protein [Flavisolibacter sp.]
MNWWQRLFSSEKSGGAEQISLKDRFSALRNLPRFFSLVWQSSPRFMLANILLRVLRSAIPVAVLYVGKLIIDGIIHIKDNPSSENFLWQLVAVEFGLLILSDALGRMISLFDSLIGEKFANSTSVQIMQHAALLDLEQFEDSQFYDKLERARQQTTGRTILLAQVLSQVQDAITMTFLAAGLVAFNPWLILLLLVAVIPAFLGESHFNNRGYALSRRQTPERRELDYIRYVGASDETAKEIKVFDLSGFFIDRFKSLSNKFYEANKKLTKQRAFWGTFFSFLGTAGYYGAYVYIIRQAVSGNLSIGDVTFLAGSFRQLRGLLEGIL